MVTPSSAADLSASSQQQERPFGLLLVALLLLAHSFFNLRDVVAFPFSLQGPWGIALLELSVLRPFAVAAAIALLGVVAAAGLWHRKRWGFWLFLLWASAVLFLITRQSLSAPYSSRGVDWMVWGPLGFVAGVLIVLLILAWRGTRAWGSSKGQSRRWAGQIALLILVGFGYVAFSIYRSLPPRTFEIAGKRFPVPPGCEAQKTGLTCPYSDLSLRGLFPNSLERSLAAELDQAKRFGSTLQTRRFWLEDRWIDGFEARPPAKQEGAESDPPSFIIPVSHQGRSAVAWCYSCLRTEELPQACRAFAATEGPSPAASATLAIEGAVTKLGHLVPKTAIRSILALSELRPWCRRTSTSPLAARAAWRLAQKQAEEWDPAPTLILVEELNRLRNNRSASWKLLFRSRAANRLLVMVVSSYGIEDVAETSAPMETLARWPAIARWSVDPHQPQPTRGHALLVDPEWTRTRRLVGTTLESPTAVWIEEQGGVSDAATGAPVVGLLGFEVLEEVRNRPPLG